MHQTKQLSGKKHDDVANVERDDVIEPGESQRVSVRQPDVLQRGQVRLQGGQVEHHQPAQEVRLPTEEVRTAEDEPSSFLFSEF